MYGLDFIEASNCVEVEVIGALWDGMMMMMMMTKMMMLIITLNYYQVEAYLKTLNFLKGPLSLSLVICSRDQSPKQWTSTVLVSPRFTGYHGMEPAH